MSAMLSAKGNRIVDAAGRTAILRGTGLGGWMNMEHFITGHCSHEEALREAMAAVLGRDLSRYFFERLLDCFFTEDDARFLASLGLNCVRIPLNYRHFEDDARPFLLKKEGFRWLDAAINACARHGLYTIIDLHALPGWQNEDWHSDNPTHVSLFWKHPHFQDRAVHLWEALADRYKGNPRVAGYNPVNEPSDPTERAILPFYRRLVSAIRKIDRRHLIFLEGNRYSLDFHMFGKPWPEDRNIVYSTHDYARPGFPGGGPYPGRTGGVRYDAEVLEKTFRKKAAYMLRHKLPCWVGEFGPVYTGTPRRRAQRLKVAADQIAAYERHGAGWSIWTYKDVGLQGLVCAAPDSPWMERIAPFLAKKARLAVDGWGSTDAGIRHVLMPVERLVAREFPGYRPFPWFSAPQQIARLVRHVLLSEAMLPEFAAIFKGVTRRQIDALAESFLFRNCVIRKPLADILSRAASPRGASHLTSAHG